jgi:hypothetical protein
VREAVQPLEAGLRHEHEHGRRGVAAHRLDRRARDVRERAPVRQPVHEHLAGAGPHRPQVALRRADDARRRRQLELEPQERSARDGVPHLELAGQADQELVALEPDDELGGVPRIDRLRRQRAARGAHEHHLLAARRDQREPRPGDGREPHRLVEIDPRDRVEVRRLVERDLRRAVARDRDEHVRRADEREVDVVAVELEHADRRAGAAREHGDLVAPPDRRPLPVRRRDDHAAITSWRTRG